MTGPNIVMSGHHPSTDSSVGYDAPCTQGTLSEVTRIASATLPVALAGSLHVAWPGTEVCTPADVSLTPGQAVDNRFPVAGGCYLPPSMRTL